MNARPNHAAFAEAALPQAREDIAWVEIDALTLGMFVHPLSRTSFMLTDDADLQAIRDSGVSGVFVDLKRSVTRRSRRKDAERRTRPEPAAASKTLLEGAPALVASPSARRADEFDRATQTLARLRAPVHSLLDDVRLGKAAGGGEVAVIVDEITASVADNAAAIISLARIRDKDSFTYAHSVAVCALMTNLARRMDLDSASQHELGTAGLLHDVGKMLIPPEILNKPGKLSGDEMALMRSHSERGHELLMKSGQLPQAALDACLSHHEKIDGTGYPHRLAGDQIGLAARMGAVCDVYDAITSNRPYKEAWSPSECLASMFTWEGHFDENILSLFIRSVGIYPVGSLVRMESGHLAVVVEQNEDDLLRPVVRLFYRIETRTPVPRRDLELAQSNADSILSRETPRKWGFTDWDREWPRMLAI